MAPLLGLAGVLAAPSAEAAAFYTTGNTPMQDLDIGPDGDVFAISEGSIAGTNGKILQWLRGEWVDFAGGGYGKRVTSDRHGRPWIVNGLGEVWRYTGDPLADDSGG